MAHMLDKTKYYLTLLYFHSGQTGMSPPRSFSNAYRLFSPVCNAGRTWNLLLLL